jgi:predicted TPR repeat methyltransferase
LQSQDSIANAIECFRRAIALEPKFVAAHQYLGNALLQQNQKQQAIICFEEVVRLEPENPVKHLIAALTGRDSERAPSGYVEKLFDEYAHKFDSHLAGTLRYSIPEKLANLLRPYSNANGQKWSILDLGCGTGLSGVSVAPYARQLVGVDLSAKMLDKARERNLYGRLEHMDLLTMMQGEAASSYDVVVAADVFVYLGKLDELVNQTHRVLRIGGLFAFSVEALEAYVGDAAAPREQRDYQLNVSGRYAHSVGYLDRLAMDNGFVIESSAATEVRRDKGSPVEGHLVLWRRSSD